MNFHLTNTCKKGSKKGISCFKKEDIYEPLHVKHRSKDKKKPRKTTAELKWPLLCTYTTQEICEKRAKEQLHRRFDITSISRPSRLDPDPSQPMDVEYNWNTILEEISESSNSTCKN